MPLRHTEWLVVAVVLVILGAIVAAAVFTGDTPPCYVIDGCMVCPEADGRPPAVECYFDGGFR